MSLFVPVKHKQPASKVLGRLTLFGLCLVVLYLFPASHVLAVETPAEDAQGGVVSDGSESSSAENSSEDNSTEGNGDGGENKGTEEAGGAEDAGDAEVDPMQDLKREAAARQKAASLPRVHLNPQAMSESFLAEQQKAHKQVWLQTGAEDGRFLALLEKERSGQPQGAVILVPGLSEHSAWPQLIDPLREELPDQGWYTIAISMPSQDHLRPPERELPVKKYDRYPGPKPDESESDENGNAEAEVPEGDDKAASEGGESAQEEGAEQTNPEPVEDQA
ncbi:MAG: alpha/beta hydrolase family protein, partial [Pseudomonadales bacterium]|nr:alpha/beta hydrolase family protein [Pseudomonadales bacterium]